MSTKITPQSDSNLDVTVTESDNLVSLDIQPASFIITGAGLGTVTQVVTGTGLTGGPITTSGTIAIDSTVATLDGGQALTNKTGLISQWTNDAGYITSETDNQTLSFATPDLTISNGNTVDLTALKTTSLAFSALTATPTTIAGYGITDAFDGVYSSLTGKPTIPTNNNQLTNGAGYTTNIGTVTPTSTDTFTNKSGAISQWTNDAGYLTSETDNQTLSFANPNLSITNGNSVDITMYDQSLNTTDDVTFNSMTADMFGVQHFTAKAREAIAAGQPVYISGHSGNTPEVMIADYADPTKMPAFGIASAAIANNNNGAIATAGDLKNVDTTGTSSGETWAVGDNLYVNGSKLTNVRPSSETQAIQSLAKVIRVHANNGQMFLSGAGRVNDVPNLDHYHVFIGNAGGVEKRQLDYTTDILNTPTIPTQTVINNNADNRLITGSATADNLNGESDFTWDGTNALIDGTATDLTTPVLHLKTDNSNWFTGQLMCSDSNGAVFTQVGRHNTGTSIFQWNITLDPEHTQPRTNVPGNGVTWPGDYFVGIEKNYSDTDEITMDMKVYGAHDGFNLTVRDDFNGGVDSYDMRPMSINARALRVMTDTGGSTRSLDVTDSGIQFFNAYTFPTGDGSANQVLQTDGAGNITFQTVSGGGSQSITPTLNGDATGYQGIDYVISITNYTDYVRYSQMNITITKDSDSSTVVSNNLPTDNGDGTFTVTIPTNALGAHTVRVKAQNFGQAESAEATMSLTLAELVVTARYWRIKDFDGGGTATNTSIMVANFRMYDTAGQTGTAYPSNMTTFNAPTPFVVSSQGAYSATYDDWKAFDSNPTSTFYWNLGTTNMATDYLAIDLGSAQSIKSWSFKSGNGSAYTGPFTIYYATLADFSDEVKLKSLEFTTDAQVVNFG